jgi:hypothetical protein
MAGARRDDVDAGDRFAGSDPRGGGDPYRGQGSPAGSRVSAEAITRLFAARNGAFAIDDVGRVHTFDAQGAITASIDVGPIADAALHDGGASLAVAAYGKGITAIQSAASRAVSHAFPVLACAGTPDGLVVGDQAGEVTLLVPELGAAQAAPLPLRAPILSIASSGTTLAVLTADGEVLTGAWPRHGTLTSVRGLRAKRPYQLVASGRGGLAVLDRERVHAIRGDEVVHASRDFAEGILAYDTTPEGGWLLTDSFKLHHLDASLRASPALTLGALGRARGLAAANERAAVWTTRGELLLVAKDGSSRALASEGVLAAAIDSRTGDLVAVHGTRGLALRRYPAG